MTDGALQARADARRKRREAIADARRKRREAIVRLVEAVLEEIKLELAHRLELQHELDKEAQALLARLPDGTVSSG